MFATAVNPGDRAEVKLQAMKGKTVEGKVTRISWALDPKTRTLRVEIDIPNPGGTLRPGLYAYATVIAEEHPDVLTVPATAVVSEKDKDVLRHRRRRQGRPPADQVGLSDGTRTEVVSGLEGARRVRGEGQRRLARGRSACRRSTQPETNHWQAMYVTLVHSSSRELSPAANLIESHRSGIR